MKLYHHRDQFFNGLYIGKPFSEVLLAFILVIVLFLEGLKKRFLLSALLSAILLLT